MSGTPVRTDRPPPLLGQHTREVLGELLGWDDERIEGLKQQGAI
jgi:crotonobetainyl-CoA:carnitine CoA-transferase CaiB-like acyl-CoA transferase